MTEDEGQAIMKAFNDIKMIIDAQYRTNDTFQNEIKKLTGKVKELEDAMIEQTILGDD